MTNQRPAQRRTIHCGNVAVPLTSQQTCRNGSGWLREGDLLYRLTDERRAQNRDEIRVTLADGSRSIESCSRRAGELFDLLTSAVSTPEPAEPLPGVVWGLHGEEGACLVKRGTEDDQIRRYGGSRVYAASQPVPVNVRLLEALRWALAWIDAVPQSTSLPAMPGFDRDSVNQLLAAADAQAPKLLTEVDLGGQVETYGPQSEDEEVGFRDGWRSCERYFGITATGAKGG